MGEATWDFWDPVCSSPSSGMGLRRDSMLAPLLGAPTLHGVTDLETPSKCSEGHEDERVLSFPVKEVFSDPMCRGMARQGL